MEGDRGGMQTQEKETLPMKPLFSEKEVKNKSADVPWKRSETDKMLDLYFGGTPVKRIARHLKRNPKAVERKIEKFRHNDFNAATRYRPFRRVSRKGKRLTKPELELVRIYTQSHFPMELAARILQRDKQELTFSRQYERSWVAEMKDVGVSLDLIMAYRYLYYVKNKPILSDQAYDELEAEEIEYGEGAKFLQMPGSDRAEDYPDHIRALALYLLFKYGKRTHE